MQTLNIAHRDIKPGNIIIADKTFKIADFGVCMQGN
jgi:serine/threonine protein kinase